MTIVLNALKNHCPILKLKYRSLIYDKTNQI